MIARKTNFLTIAVLHLMATGLPAATVGTTFTYQGQLKDGGAPANGDYDMRFSLYDAANGGNLHGGPLVFDGGPANAPAVAVANGLFSVELDFANSFDGTALWLHIEVRPHATGNYAPLTPRQPLTATPFALYALDGPGGAGPWTANGGNIHNTNAGNVGIGTTTPAAPLHVVGDIRSDGPFGVAAYNPNNVGAVAALGWLNDVARIRIGGNGAGSSGGLDIQKTGDRSLMRIYDSGDVWFRGGLDVSGGATVNGDLGVGVTIPRLDLEVQRSGPFVGNDPPTTMGAVWHRPGIPQSVDDWLFLSVGGSTALGGAPQLGTHLVRKHTSALNFSVSDSIPNGGYTSQVTLAANGNMGLGIVNPLDKLHVAGNVMLDGGSFRSISPNDPTSEVFLGWGADSAGTNMARIRVGGDGPGSTNGLDIQTRANRSLMRIMHSGRVGIGTTNPGALLDVQGSASVHVLTIVGADVAEKFPVSEKGEAFSPGTVVEIDPANPGNVRIARGAYNRRVAGVVSGAGDIPTGTILGNLPGSESAPPVALAGRVWVRCDATHGPIAAGDLLTTSENAGYAAKTTDFARAQGAIIGKAMTGLAEGTGLVLVLVSLQ